MHSSRMRSDSGFGGLLLPGDLAIVQNQGMQIAVAGMKYVGDAQSRLLR